MQSLRLDYIANINQRYLDKIREIRKMYIDLDLALQEFEDDENFSAECGAVRSVSIARTHLETSSMYANKALCLMGENK